MRRTPHFFSSTTERSSGLLTRIGPTPNDLGGSLQKKMPLPSGFACGMKVADSIARPLIQARRRAGRVHGVAVVECAGAKRDQGVVLS